MSSGWRFNGAQLLKTSMELVSPTSFSEKDDPIFPSCSSASMVDSFGQSFNGGLLDLYSKVSSSSLPILAHPSSASFPADSAFIEQAATLSCFNGGNLMEVAFPFGIPQAMALYSRSLGTNQEMNSIDGMRLATVGQPQKQRISDLGEASMDVCLDHGTENPENDGKRENLLRSHKDQKPTLGRSGGESEDEGPSTAEGGEEEPSGNRIKPRKRKGVKQNTELDQGKEKSTGKHSKQGSKPSDPPKEEYIHVRARRGQATNSHSLAERVRREKISERMKFLQDLVPGCSKVIGKAVMLDEIINYVQSLQQQVEFLSMKLATVHPRMDFDIDGLANEILQARPDSSSSMGYSPEMSMAFPPLQPSQRPLLSSGAHCMGSSGKILRRTLSSHSTMPMPGGFMEPAQLPNVWEDELHHVFKMSCASSNTQTVDDS